MCIRVNVNLPRGGGKIISVCEKEEQLNDLTVLDLKGIIKKLLASDDDLRVVFQSKILEEKASLKSSMIGHMSTIHTLLRLPGG